jgi:phage gpG-like protein
MRAGRVTLNIDRSRLATLTASAINAGVGAASAEALKAIRNSFTKTTRWQSSPPGQPPGTGTGNLRRSFAITPPQNGRAFVTTSANYARVQEFGGTLRPTSKRYLTVPLNVRAKAMRANTKDLRTQALSVIRSAKGKLLLVRHKGRGRGQQIEPMFLLTRSVTLPARPYIRPTMAKQETKAAMTTGFIRRFVSEFRKGFRAMVGI